MTRVSASLRRLIVMVLVLQFFSVSVTRIYSIILLLGNNGAVNRALLRQRHHRSPVAADLQRARRRDRSRQCRTAVRGVPDLQRARTNSTLAARGCAYAGRPARRTFWQIVFPLSLPGVGASVVIVFLYSLGAFATPLMLGGGFVDLISVFAYEQAINFSNYGFAAAGAIVSTVLGLVLVYAFTVARRS